MENEPELIVTDNQEVGELFSYLEHLDRTRFNDHSHQRDMMRYLQDSIESLEEKTTRMLGALLAMTAINTGFILWFLLTIGD